MNRTSAGRRRLRWVVWPGEGARTQGSEDAVCGWLSTRGAPDSLEQPEANKRARATAKRRRDA
jgi:hypothetical protein